MNPSLNALVLRVRQQLLERSIVFYECLGFSFKEEKHGKGPVHYASESNGYLFELYPLMGREYPQPHARLSFRVNKEVIERIKTYNESTKLSGSDRLPFLCHERDYGYISKDPMGRYVELHLEK